MRRRGPIVRGDQVWRKSLPSHLIPLAGPPVADAVPIAWHGLRPVCFRFGVNSDDGFEVDATPLPGVPGAPIRLGIFDGNRGADNTLFDFLIQTGGLYSFQVIYFESKGNASEEFFSVTNLATGGKALINDPGTPSAIKSYRVLKPRIISIAKSGQNAILNWAYGAPPFQVQVATNLVSPVWIDTGAPTANRSATVPIQPGIGFIRVGFQ